MKDSHKAYMEHIETERKKLKKRCSNAELEEMKKKRKRKVKSSLKDLDVRESRAEQILQSASGFLEEGDKRMANGLAENDMDEIEAAQKIIQLAHENRKRHKMSFKLFTKKRESLLINLENRPLRK